MDVLLWSKHKPNLDFSQEWKSNILRTEQHNIITQLPRSLVMAAEMWILKRASFIVSV